LEDGRLTLLVLGSDSDANRRARGSGWLTDAITVVSVSADGSHVLMVSLPRDTSDIPMPDGSVWSGKVNAIAPILGPAVLGEAMGLLLGLGIDHYVMVDMDGFRQIADAVGGVPVSVPQWLTSGACTIGPGEQVLDGTLALCYARHRGDTDYARADRHQQLLLGIRDRVLAGGLEDPAGLIGAVGSLQTDIPAEDISSLIELAIRTADAEVDRLVLGPPEFTTFAGFAGDRGWISIPNVPAIQATVATLLE
jgi:LCP family protein required for cell wall assembly